MKPTSPHLDVSIEELQGLLEHARQEPLQPDAYEKLRSAVHTLGHIAELLENREATLDTLRRVLCQSSSEKTKEVLQRAGIEVSEKHPEPAGQRASETPAPGHGRNGAAAYSGAHKVQVRHASLAAGDRCPDCDRGKVYAQANPHRLLRLKGQVPIDGTVYELERLRCNLCGKIFTAAAPEGVGDQKYDATASSMIALLRYGSGFPWNRLERLQRSMGIPLPAATQCQIMAQTAVPLGPAHEELIRQAAQGGLFHNDDTSMRVLALNKAQAHTTDSGRERTGVSRAGSSRLRPARISLCFSPGASTREKICATC